MDFLAYLTLSYPSAGLVGGNFIGDHVRNKDLVHFTKEVRLGIDMHRRIDSFTDKHKASTAIREKLLRITDTQAEYWLTSITTTS